MEADSWGVAYALSDLPQFDLSVNPSATASAAHRSQPLQRPTSAAGASSSSPTRPSAAALVPSVVSAALRVIPTHRDDALLQMRVGALEEIFSTGLSTKAYRNVVRSAEFDCGASCVQMAADAAAMAEVLKLGGTVITQCSADAEEVDGCNKGVPATSKAEGALEVSDDTSAASTADEGGAPATEADVAGATATAPPPLSLLSPSPLSVEALTARREASLDNALRYYQRFADGFAEEMAEAREEGRPIDSALEASDYPTIVVGEMRVAEVLLKKGRYAEAKRRLEANVMAFIADNPSILRRYPEVAMSRAQCVELLAALDAVLNGGGGGKSAAAVPINPPESQTKAPSLKGAAAEGSVMDEIA